VARQDKSGLFRREALDRLDDIDDLDRLVTVTHPRAWLALGAVAVLLVVALAWASFGRLDTTVSGQGVLLAGGRTLSVSALESGRIVRLTAAQGERVTAGQIVATVAPSDGVLDAHGAIAQDPVTSPYDGIVGSVQAYPGQYVASGAPLLTVVPEEPLIATLYLPLDESTKVKKGAQVDIAPAGVSPDEYGYIRARVTFVAGVASTPEDLLSVLQNEFLARQFSAAGPVARIEAALVRDPATPSGFAWSSSDGPDVPVTDGTTCTARIVLSSAAPITYAFPALGRLGGAE
jgi:multidrug efflux pump subunit AcrA (membrane-fusion protein)